jgi:RNA polymerase sigma factor (sigma-70 family)
MKDSIQHIISECRIGNRRAQNQLYQKYSHKLFSICLRYAGNRFEAEDLIQEAFIRIFQCLHQLENINAFEGWMRRITVNVALERFRKKSIVFKTGVDSENQTADFCDSIEADSSVNTAELLAMIQSLPDGYRMVFNLYAIEGFSHKEIAEQLNISEGTSKSQLSRARMLLQQKCYSWFGDSLFNSVTVK